MGQARWEVDRRLHFIPVHRLPGKLTELTRPDDARRVRAGRSQFYYCRSNPD